MTSENIVDRLAELFVIYGVPESIRSDNGPEFVSNEVDPNYWTTGGQILDRGFRPL